MPRTKYTYIVIRIENDASLHSKAKVRDLMRIAHAAVRRELAGTYAKTCALGTGGVGVGKVAEKRMAEIASLRRRR